jgi:asparagine synthase (glutamine-hydrolysing)
MTLHLAEQSSAPMEYVADLRDIATPRAERRQVVDPDLAASLLLDETRSRIDTVLRSQPGVPVVLLSGGADSIFVAAVAVSLGVAPQAITIVTEGATDETNAAAAARALGLRHDIVRIRVDEIAMLAREAIARLGTTELWEVSYAIPLLGARPVLDLLPSVGPILAAKGADAILAGGRTLTHPIDSAEAVAELDAGIRRESANNFTYSGRLVPDFYSAILGPYADRLVHVFQTTRLWELCETFAAPALFVERDGLTADKACLRIACERVLPDAVKSLAWAKKSPMQKSSGVMDALTQAARFYAAGLPGAQTYTDPRNEPIESVAIRLLLTLLDNPRA